MMKESKPFVILFVEGETEKEFYEALLKFYKDKSKNAICGYRIYNMKGIGRFENKAIAKLKIEIIPKFKDFTLKVICCYDTDVFDLAQKPPVNWKVVEKKVNELGISSFGEVRAKQMIEDWFLKDLSGLCKFLNIPVPKKLEGKSGNDKMKILFKSGKKPKVYQKGTNSHKFIPSLNIESIRNNYQNELSDLEEALGFEL